MHQAAEGLSALANSLDVSPATLAVAWAAAHPAAPMPIISGRTAEQIAPSLAAMAFQIDAALYDQIEALSPRPAPATDRLEEQELGA
jgi:aryl-alcohol dehydrogenase-like predicted oxidoreductase